jgi:hypothetical protein
MTLRNQTDAEVAGLLVSGSPTGTFGVSKVVGLPPRYGERRIWRATQDKLVISKFICAASAELPAAWFAVQLMGVCAVDTQARSK